MSFKNKKECDFKIRETISYVIIIIIRLSSSTHSYTQFLKCRKYENKVRLKSKQEEREALESSIIIYNTIFEYFQEFSFSDSCAGNVCCTRLFLSFFFCFFLQRAQRKYFGYLS